MPAIVDRSPVTIAIGSSGLSPVLARWIKGVIETLLPARLGALAELAGRWRQRVREQVLDPTERRHFWERVVTGAVAEHAFAGRDAEAERALPSALSSWGSDDVARRGEAYVVGAGPGGIDLITIRGRQLLATADVVLYDRLVSAELLQYARRDAELICVGKTPRRPSISQKQLNRLLVSLVQAGKRVCRLKGGDPFIFGRGGEELEALAEAGLKFQVVPGVSAAEGCAAYAGIPLTLRGVAQAVLLTTGHTRDDGMPTIGEFRPGPNARALHGRRAVRGNRRRVDRERLCMRNARRRRRERHDGPSARRPHRARRFGRGAGRAAKSSHRRCLIVGETTRYAERYSWFAPSKVEHFADRAGRRERSCKLPTKHQQGCAMIYESILDTIGNTPVVKLHRIPPKHVTIYVKIEAFNPLSSVKDRLAFAIIDDAERRGMSEAGPDRRRSDVRQHGHRARDGVRGARAIRSSRRWSRRSPSSGARSCARSARR